MAAVVTAGALLGPVPAQAAPGDTTPVFASGASETPMSLEPLARTAAGFVYREGRYGPLWVEPTGEDAAVEDRLDAPQVTGDLIYEHLGIPHLVGGGGGINWRTIGDPTLHEDLVPDDLSYEVATDRATSACAATAPTRSCTSTSATAARSPWSAPRPGRSTSSCPAPTVS
jgi:hypothetical protein